MMAIACGMPRSATKSIAVLLKTLGFPAYHQSVGTITHEGNFLPYLLPNELDKWESWFKRKKTRMDGLIKDGNYFEANWELANVICVLYKYYPDLELFVMVRDITGNANSLKHYREMDRITYPVDHYARAWIRVYSFVCDQLEHCKPKAYLVDFHKYTQGAYTDFLFDHFGIPRTEDNLKTASKILSRKVNHRGGYGVYRISKDLLSEAEEVRTRLESLCTPLS